MRKVKLPQHIVNTYEKELYSKTTDLKIINQLIKMIDYGCFIYCDNFNLEIFRRLKSLFQKHSFFLNAINEFNMYHNIIEDENTCTFYFVYGESHHDYKDVKIINIKQMEVFNKDLEEKRLDIIEIAKNESTINLIDKIKTNYLYKKYFKKINKYFVNEIEEQDLEKLEFLAIEYVHNKFRGFISSVNEDFLWAKTSKTIEDIKNKKELSSWQILLLNDLMIDTKYIKP